MSEDIGEIQISTSKGRFSSGGGCKGTCTRYKAKKPFGIGRYAVGQKRCQICEIFIKWEGIWCPCCGYRVRGKPRNSEYKARLRDRRESEREPQS